ncbi:WD40 repeat [Trinorchestia longiramus]|nr:WD40 repeat [Trinorchestia longiramus]
MSVSIVTCSAWVPQGQAKANPEKVEVNVEDLKKIIEETEAKLEDIKSSGEKSDPDDSEEDAEDGTGPQNTPTNKSEQPMDVDDNPVDEQNIEKLYNFSTYDQEDDNHLKELLSLKNLTMYGNPADDPLLVEGSLQAKEEDEKSETENHKILADDNLIAVGHVENDAAILEVYVYNEAGDALYVHHDNLLPTVPLCMEWLNYNPIDEQLAPGNLVAVGTMEPQIEVWDLDLIDGLEPAFKLGDPRPSRADKKKNRRKKKKANYSSKITGHTDAVLCITWNKEYEHVLASGSADTNIILWDLQNLSVSQVVSCCSGRVQSLQWHPNNGSTLLAGSAGGDVHVINCKDGSSKSWQLEGDIEKVLWVKCKDEQFAILASNDKGLLYCLNQEEEEPVWMLNPHEKSCTGIQISSKCPGLLVTAAEDHTIRVWDGGELMDLLTTPPTFVVQLSPQVGKIFSLTAALEHPFVFCIGGDQKDNCFKVWDIRASSKVREKFCPRLGLPVDAHVPDKTCLEQQIETSEDVEARFMSDMISGAKKKSQSGRIQKL